MRKAIKNLYNPFLQFYFTLRLKSFIANNAAREIVVLDIDNTIADTWKHLGTFAAGRKKFFLKLPVLHGTIQYIRENYSALPIVFLSNRNITDIRSTKKWLRNAGFDLKENMLIVTNDPQDKLAYLQLLACGKKVIYFDDLSYNHENGKVLFYDDVLRAVRLMDIKYYDYQFILKLNS